MIQNNTAWGVEFGGSALRRVRVTRTGSTYRVDRYTEVGLDDRWEKLPDVSTIIGQIHPGKFAEAAAACIADELVLYRSFCIPNAKSATLRNMVCGQLEVLIPNHIDQFATNWRSFPDPYKSGFQRVLVSATRRESLSGPIEACKRLGCPAAVIVPSMLALATVWARMCDQTDRPVAILDVGARCTGVAIMQNGQVLQCGVIDLGGDHWTEQIAEQLNISRRDAEQQKLDFIAGASAKGSDHRLAPIIKESLTRWIPQLREVYGHCVGDIPREARPDHCVVFGRSARIPGLVSLVSSTLGLEATAAHPPDRLSLAEGVDFVVSAPAIGAALCVMETDVPAVFLFSKAKKKSVFPRKPVWRWVAIFVWLLASVLTLYWLDLAEASKLDKNLQEVRERTSLDGGLGRRSAIGKYLESIGPTPLDILGQISDALPGKAIMYNWSKSSALCNR